MDQRGMSVSSSLTEKDELESPRAMLAEYTLVEMRQQFRISELLKIIDFDEQLFIESAAEICNKHFYRTMESKREVTR